MFQCKDLLTLPALAEIKTISGQSGMENRIRWVYKPEDMHFKKWVSGHELMIISTPVIQCQDFDLLTLIQEAVHLNMSGALLLVGSQYIAKIPKEVIHYTNQNKFPLFVIPGNIPLIDIFEEIGHAIAYSDTRENDGEDLLSSIIFGNKINVDALVMKSEMIGYDITPPQQIFVMRFFPTGEMESYDRRLMTEYLNARFLEYGIQIFLSHYGNNFVGMFQVFDHLEETLNAIFQKMEQFLKEEYPQWKIYMGVGKGYERLERLQESFREASRCIVLAERRKQESGIWYFRKLGFYNLLFEIKDTSLIETFVEDTLGEIIKYDQENNSNLLETLKIYIERDGSLLHTSETLHMHRNTVKYRIGRIQQITGKSLDKEMTRLEFMNAIICQELYRS